MIDVGGGRVRPVPPVSRFAHCTVVGFDVGIARVGAEPAFDAVESAIVVGIP